MTTEDPQRDDIQALLEDVHRCYGYDFRDYARASLQRRIQRRMEAEGVAGVAELREKIGRDRECMEHLVLAFSIDVTSMFRDPGFYRVLRETVVPWLRTLPFIRIWDAGCSTGEEVYSVAILLSEAGLLDRARLYATDMSEAALRRARAGIFPLGKMKEYTRNYQAMGGTRSFSEYYTAGYAGARFNSDLVKRVVWAQHNLVTDASFNEFHLILCRNVMIYFNRSLQNRVHRLLYDSLALSGILGLGDRESIRLTPHEDCYRPLDQRERVYQKVR